MSDAVKCPACNEVMPATFAQCSNCGHWLKPPPRTTKTPAPAAPTTSAVGGDRSEKYLREIALWMRFFGVLALIAIGLAVWDMLIKIGVLVISSSR